MHLLPCAKVVHETLREISTDSIDFDKFFYGRTLKGTDPTEVAQQCLSFLRSYTGDVFDLRSRPRSVSFLPMARNRKSVRLVSDLPQQEMGRWLELRGALRPGMN